jgi:hypothetical protein
MPRSPRARLRVGLLGLALLLPLAVGGSPASAVTTEFPAGFSGYHTYAEMVAEVAATAAAHPSIMGRTIIGSSYQGRAIWAAKISDNVGVDESEPEVLFDGLTHADEHMGLEMTLKIMHWLVDGYGVDSRITNIVNTREIWIIFAVNPDGGEYDISGGKFHFWRKNRQPTPGTGYIGTDLNRNFGYQWGLEGNTSTNPAAITYRGPFAFSGPETRMVRDFLTSRVVDGRQQIRTAMTFHEYGRLVMWPYGYTYLDVPADMTADDHTALAGIGRAMAASNGYRPEQASDLYLTSGTTRDYEYGVYRIFSYTFELSIKDYPDDSLIPSETGRNKGAVLYLMELAGCPLGVLGAAVRAARCGAFDDDLEVSSGWRVNLLGTDTATAGGWQQGDPAGTSTVAGPAQLPNAASGRYDMATGLAAGASAAANDVDGGRTTVTSRRIVLPPAAGQALQFRWAFAYDVTSRRDDEFRVEVIDDASGLPTTVFRMVGTGVDRAAVWRTASIPLDAFAGRTVRLRFSAADMGTDNLLEAAFDDVRVTQPS